MPVRILIADDHDIVRLGIRALLAADPRWYVCGEAVDGDDAIRQVETLLPDIVILDLSMPKVSGFQAAQEIKRVAPFTKIVFLSMHDTPTIARTLGADAFVLKSTAVQQLPSVLERVLAEVSH